VVEPLGFNMVHDFNVKMHEFGLKRFQDMTENADEAGTET